ncbi:hypothetical protein STAS_13817 [Striga asiatica]|uniref:Ribosomal protein L34Ae n=1 Tax=Striga asiatica TaxID=4170 RepID=A0A5A7PZ69_STRAF|nr:hypothetical protein STAS_13817 [Striga asiatica]
MGLHYGVLSQKMVSAFQIVSAYVQHFFNYILSRLQKCIGYGFLKKNIILFLEKIAPNSFYEEKEKNSELDSKFKISTCEEFSTIKNGKVGSFIYYSELESEDVSEFDEEFLNVSNLISCEENHNERMDLLENDDFTNFIENHNKYEKLENYKYDRFEDFNLGPKNDVRPLWEHQELIDQLKVELRRERSSNLPTILEESESPKLVGGKLKGCKIDDEHQKCMAELHKSYHSYTQMMRKFDILNYQKMYAMGFLQVKDSFESSPHPKKAKAPTLKSLVFQKLWLLRPKRHGTEPMKKLAQQLLGDFEVVYVGQMCLSWEFLHFQYGKALHLWSCDPCGIRKYNEVANEFRQFRALMQRFIADEHCQGSRVQNYVKNRCVLRNLLQVPLVREDYTQNNNEAYKKDRDVRYGVTSEMLVEMILNSIQIFRKFVQSDNDCNSSPINGNKKLPNLHNSEDLKLLLQVRKKIQKKEKKLRDVLKSENCILRKFGQNKEDDVDHIFAQIDMKLMCRVFNMSKITRDQLMWCGNKLSKISFVSRKINVEPGIVPFPCSC